MTLLSRDEIQNHAAAIVERLIPGLLIRTSAASIETGFPLGGDMDISASIELTAHRPSSLATSPIQGLMVEVEYTVEATFTDQSALTLGRNGWRCQVALQGLWNIEGDKDPSDNELRSFAARVGVMALHPYARSHIQQAVTEAAWPPFTMDVLTPAGAIFESAEHPGMCDLDGIQVL